MKESKHRSGSNQPVASAKMPATIAKDLLTVGRASSIQAGPAVGGRARHRTNRAPGLREELLSIDQFDLQKKLLANAQGPGASSLLNQSDAQDQGLRLLKQKQGSAIPSAAVASQQKHKTTHLAAATVSPGPARQVHQDPNGGRYHQSKPGAPGKSVIGNGRSTLVHSFASEAFSPQITKKIEDSRYASGKERRITHFVESLMANGPGVAAAVQQASLTGPTTASSRSNDPNHRAGGQPGRGAEYQSLQRSRLQQNKTMSGQSAGNLDGRYQARPSQAQTIYTIGKGEPTLPGPLGWPKLTTNTPNITIAKGQIGQMPPAQGTAFKDSTSPAIFQNISKFGKTQMSPNTPEQTQSHLLSLDTKITPMQEPNWQMNNQLSPGGAYSSTAPQRTQSLTESGEASAVAKVRPDSILSRNLAQGHQTAAASSSKLSGSQPALRQTIPKHGGKAGSPGVNPSAANRYQGVYGQALGPQKPFQAAPQGPTQSATPSVRGEQPAVQNSPMVRKIHGPDRHAPLASDPHIDSVPEILPGSSTRLKDFPLSTKNKSMPPFSLPGSSQGQSQAPQGRNLPPVVLNPIQQAKSQYYREPKGAQPKAASQARQLIGVNTYTLMQLQEGPSSIAVRTGEGSAYAEKDLVKADRGSMLKTIEIESNRTEALFRTQWAPESEQRLTMGNDTKRQNEIGPYTGVVAGNAEGKRAPLQVLSPQIRKQANNSLLEHRNIKLKRKFPVHDLAAAHTDSAQSREAYAPQASVGGLHAHPYESTNSRMQRMSRDPEADLSQLDHFDRVLRRRNEQGQESNASHKQPRYRFDDQGRKQRGDQAQVNTSELLMIRSSGDTINRKQQRYGYQPAAIGRQPLPSAQSAGSTPTPSQAYTTAAPNLLNIEPLHSSLVYLKPSKAYDTRANDLTRFDEEPFNLFQLSFMHFAEQFFNRSKAEKNFQNIQRAALLVLVVGRALRAIELVRWHHAKIVESLKTDASAKDAREGGDGPEQKHLQAMTGCLSYLLACEHELYSVVKQLVGGVCQWVLKRVNKGQKPGEDGGGGAQENSWVKKLQHIIRAQYEGLNLVQVVDYAQIIHYCQKIQEKLGQVKQQLGTATPSGGPEKGSPDSKRKSNRHIMAANHEKLQSLLSAMSQIVQQAIVQQESQKIIAIEKFLQIMSKLETLDSTFASAVNSNMSSATLPRATMESAMTTLGHKSRNPYPGSVERKKNSTPHTLFVPGGAGGPRGEAHTLMAGQGPKLEEAHASKDNSGGQRQPKGASVGRVLGTHNQTQSLRVGAGAGPKASDTITRPPTVTQDGAGDFRKHQSEPREQQDSALADVNNHQKSLKERIEAYKRQEEEQKKRNDAVIARGPTGRRQDSPPAGSLTSRQGTPAAVVPKPLQTERTKAYTLVLDLDETLVHFKDSKYLTDDQKLKIRPGVAQFLEALDPYYTFVVFTAAQKMYADFVISRIDPEGIYIKDRFYRGHCRLIGKHQAKDLNLVITAQNKQAASSPRTEPDGRATVRDPRDGQPSPSASPGPIDLNKIIIIDNLSESFQLQPLNGIKIRDWFGNDLTDRHLLDLIPPLKAIAERRVHDVRLELSKIRKNQLHATMAQAQHGGIYNNGAGYGFRYATQPSPAPQTTSAIVRDQLAASAQHKTKR